MRQKRSSHFWSVSRRPSDGLRYSARSDAHGMCPKRSASAGDMILPGIVWSPPLRGSSKVVTSSHILSLNGPLGELESTLAHPKHGGSGYKLR